MRVQVYTLCIIFRNDEKWFYDISRTAVQRYVDWYCERPDYCGFRYEPETWHLKRSNNWLAGT